MDLKDYYYVDEDNGELYALPEEDIDLCFLPPELDYNGEY